MLPCLGRLDVEDDMITQEMQEFLAPPTPPPAPTHRRYTSFLKSLQVSAEMFPPATLFDFEEEQQEDKKLKLD
jgi:hypothetical protein